MPRQRRIVGTYIRSGRIAGNENRLNENAVKVLAAIRLAPHAAGMSEIKQATSLEESDVMRQIRLLLELTMIQADARYPIFPAANWKVFTNPAKRTMIDETLRQHGVAPTRREEQREAYHPVGMALEGEGVQQNRGRTYPPDVPFNDDLEYKQETLELMKHWKEEIKPYEPRQFSRESVQEKFRKFKYLLDKLSEIYHVPKSTVLVGTMSAESWRTPLSSGSSCYNRVTDTITLEGKFSVITTLHEFGHKRGFDEPDAQMWAVNLFRKIFPEEIPSLSGHGHCLVQR